jgi:hypothetical protein
MARPSIKFAGELGSQDAPVAAALVFDTSMRMDYKHENQTRLEVAREMGLWLLKQLPENSEVGVLDSRPGPGAFQVDRGAAVHRIEMLETAADSQPLTNVLDEALRLVATSELSRKEVYVFTDMAQAAWPTGMAARFEQRIGGLSDTGIYLIDVGVEEPVNTALGELKLSQEILANRSPLRIRTDVSHVGPPDKRTAELHLFQAGKGWEKRHQQEVDAQGERPQAVEFTVGALDVGTHQGYVKLVGQDGLACDDRRYFTVEVKPPWRVLVAAPEPATDTGRYLSDMLAPASFVKSGRARFDCSFLDQNELRKHPLNSYSAVCLVDPRPLVPAEWQELINYASDGHGVAVFLGPGATNAGPFNDDKAQELLPAKLISKLNAPDGVMYLAPDNLDHPILASFRGLQGTVPWETVAVFRYWQLGKLAAGVRVVVPYSSGRPAILEREVGAGRAVIVTTPLSVQPGRDPWNLMPYDGSGTAVILVNGIVSYLVGGADQQLNYLAGQPAVLQLDPDAEYRSYALSLLNQPEAMEVRLTPDLKRRALVIASTSIAGNYRVQAGGATSGVNRGFSVNIDPRSTAMERIDRERLAEALGPLEFQITRERDDLDERMNTGRVGRELFPLLVFVLAFILGVEHVVANRFYRQ